MITGVGNPNSPDLHKAAAKEAGAQNPVAEAAHARNAERKAESGPEDRVSLGSKRPEGTYGKPAPGAASLDARLLVMQELVSKMFEKQGLSTTIDIGGGQTASLADITPEQATDLVSEEGYWGVDKTSERIAGFAIQAAGNDPSKLDAIKESVMKGYGMAEKGFGGSLPDISKKTLESVMSKLDEWAKSQSAAGRAESAEQPEPPDAA
jgi:hypothetical protein